MRLTKLAVAVFVLSASAGTALAQDVAAGETAFRKCQPCHDVGESARSKLGPALNGLDGRSAGSVEGYDYSDAGKSSGIVWSAGDVQRIHRGPSSQDTGNQDDILGRKMKKEIADLWAYLKQFGTEGGKK